VDQHIALFNIGLDQLIKPFEECRDILVLAIDKWISYMMDSLSDYDVLHVFGGSNNFLITNVPVRILLLRWKSLSIADWASPR
jgi:hypothetical protein